MKPRDRTQPAPAAAPAAPGPWQALEQASKEWKVTFDAITFPLMVLDRQYKIVRANAAAISFLGLSKDKVLGHACFELMHGTDHPPDGCPFSKAIETRKHEEAELCDNVRGLRLFVSADPVLDESGELAGVVHAIQDITARKRAEEALRESEEGLRLLISAVRDYAIIRLDPEGKVLSWNAGAERIQGYPAEEIVGAPFARFYTEEDAAAGKPQQALETARSLGRCEDEGWRVRKDGSRFWAVTAIAPMTDAAGQLRGFAKVTRDLTERKRAEEAMRALAGQLLSAQEAERRLIAREMHDDLTQRLAVLAIDAARMEAERPPASPLAGRLKDLKEALIRLSQDVHALSRQLHPSILDDLGLVEALRSECTAIAQREGIAVRYTPRDIPLDLPKEVALCLYRIAQEGLRNVAKHSGAREAAVSLAATEDGMLLSIEDAGCGFAVAAPHKRRGVGLASMAERARLIGGDLSVRSEQGKGTLIEVWAPLAKGPRNGPAP